jgi:hypothetical protein
MVLDIGKDGLRTDNTDGYCQEKLDNLNEELEGRLQYEDTYSDDYYEIIQNFNDEIAHR